MYSTDHQRAGSREKKHHWMKREAGNHDLSEPEGLAQCALCGSSEHQHHQQQRRWDGSSLEVLHFVSALRQRLGGDVVARQTRHSACDKIGQDNTVVQTLHPATVPDHGGGPARSEENPRKKQATPPSLRLFPPPAQTSPPPHPKPP